MIWNFVSFILGFLLWFAIVYLKDDPFSPATVALFFVGCIVIGLAVSAAKTMFMEIGRRD